MSNYDHTTQPEKYRKEHSEPILRRLATIGTSLHTLGAVVSTMERALPGHKPVPDMAGTFISAYVKGPVPAEGIERKAQSPSIPTVALNKEEIRHYVAVGGHFTIAEMEARLTLREQGAVVSKTPLASHADIHGMKDIFAELEAQPQPPANKTKLRAEINNIDAGQSLEEYFAQLDAQPAVTNSQEIQHTPSELATQVSSRKMVSDLQKFLEENSMENAA
jgi:hypothetical protein